MSPRQRRTGSRERERRGSSYEQKLIDALEGPLPDRRLLAARVLGQIRSRAALPALARLARDLADPYLGAECARALAAIDPTAPIVRDVAEKGPTLVRAALRSFAAREGGPQGRSVAANEPTRPSAFGGTEDEIDRLVARLDSLLDGPAAVAALVACGPRAAGPLRWFLLEGRPASVFEPRRWAVEALAGLGAKDVLMEYLREPREVSDSVVRLGEDAVAGAAARALAAWRTDDVFALLLWKARIRPVAGLVEALGVFERPEAIPVLIQALEDDLTRRAAEDALRSVIGLARSSLVETSLEARPDEADESPSSLQRRRRALDLLATTPLSAEEWGRLRPLLASADARVAVSACGLAARNGTDRDRRAAAGRLLEELPRADAFLQIEIEEVLTELRGRHGHGSGGQLG